MLTSLVPDNFDPTALNRVTQALSEADGVAFASPPCPTTPTGGRRGRSSPPPLPRTRPPPDTVAHLRQDVLPAVTAGTGLDVAITGQVAVGVDFSDYLADRLPAFFGAVLALSFLLLMVVFRSVLCR